MTIRTFRRPEAPRVEADLLGRAQAELDRRHLHDEHGLGRQRDTLHGAPSGAVCFRRRIIAPPPRAARGGSTCHWASDRSRTRRCSSIARERPAAAAGAPAEAAEAGRDRRRGHGRARGGLGARCGPGTSPIVLEARARVGGRVHTLREPFTDGLYAEAGAMRIPRTHDLTLAYCERFGLPLPPFTRSATRTRTSTSAAAAGGSPRCRPTPAVSRSRWRDGECGRPVDALWARGDRRVRGAGRAGTGTRRGRRSRRSGTTAPPGSSSSTAAGPRAPSRPSACSSSRRP